MTLNQQLWNVMNNEGNDIFSSYRKKEVHLLVNSYRVLSIIDKLAILYGGKRFYFHVLFVDYQPDDLIVRMTYVFEHSVQNLLFRNRLLQENIPYHTTGIRREKKDLIIHLINTNQK